MSIVIKCNICKKEADECCCPKFKIGDKVRITNFTERPLLGGLNVGDIGTIIELFEPAEHHDIYVSFECGPEPLLAQEVELVPEVPEVKFKIGDKVRITDKYKGEDKYIGNVGKIKEIDTTYEFPIVVTFENELLTELCSEHELELVSEESDKALRFNSNKVEFDDMPLLGMVEVAKVAAYGRSKYSKNNWRKGASTGQYLNCAIRHIMKYMYGEETDDESQCLHLGHAAWNILAELEKMITNTRIDDRFKYPGFDNVSDAFELNEVQQETNEKMAEKKDD